MDANLVPPTAAWIKTRRKLEAPSNALYAKMSLAQRIRFIRDPNAPRPADAFEVAPDALSKADHKDQLTALCKPISRSRLSKLACALELTRSTSSKATIVAKLIAARMSPDWLRSWLERAMEDDAEGSDGEQNEQDENYGVDDSSSSEGEAPAGSDGDDDDGKEEEEEVAVHPSALVPRDDAFFTEDAFISAPAAPVQQQPSFATRYFSIGLSIGGQFSDS